MGPKTPDPSPWNLYVLPYLANEICRCGLEMGRLYCRREGHVMEAEGISQRKKRCLTSGCKDGERGQEPRGFRNADVDAEKKQGSRFCPGTYPGSMVS